MFVNPEYYFETEVPDKNPEAIIKFIRKHQRDINKQKRILERPEFSEDIWCSPGSEGYIWFDRECIAAAKKILSEQGVDYLPTRSEQADEDFQNNIEFIRQIRFEIGGCFDEGIVCTIDITGGNVTSKFTTRSGLRCEEKELSEDWNEPEELFCCLKEIHFGEWRRNYNISRWGIEVCDGVQWSLTFSYNNGHKDNKYHGDNDYPYNFSLLTEPLGIEFCPWIYHCSTETGLFSSELCNG